jgi:fructose-1,6-bisphosphatase/inositol monophosphatase family enzyme
VTLALVQQRLPAVLRQLGAELMVPAWRNLAASDVREKAPNELVTTIDLAVEAALAQALTRWTPGAPCLGEEAISADPGLLDALPTADLCWLIDPLDGTSNFVEGSPHFAIMVAAVQRGAAIASWIYHPLPDLLYCAEAGAGAWCNHLRLQVEDSQLPWQAQSIGAHVGFLPEGLKAPVAAALASARDSRVFRSAGHEYPAVATGTKAAMLAYRILPWDHAPGALLVSEAGGAVIRFDGTQYGAAQPGHGLIAASSLAAALDTRNRLIPDTYRSFLT